MPKMKNTKISDKQIEFMKLNTLKTGQTEQDFISRALDLHIDFTLKYWERNQDLVENIQQEQLQNYKP